MAALKRVGEKREADKADEIVSVQVTAMRGMGKGTGHDWVYRDERRGTGLG